MEILRFPGLGWELPISRVALSIGNLDIYWYGVIIAVGFGLGLWVYLSHNRTCGIHPDEGLDIILWAMVGAIVGARAYYVAFQWDNYKDNLKEIFNLRGGGLAIYGGIIGALIVAFIVCRIKKASHAAGSGCGFPRRYVGTSDWPLGQFLQYGGLWHQYHPPLGYDIRYHLRLSFPASGGTGRAGRYGGSGPAGTPHLPI